MIQETERQITGLRFLTQCNHDGFSQEAILLTDGNVHCALPNEH